MPNRGICRGVISKLAISTIIRLEVVYFIEDQLSHSTEYRMAIAELNNVRDSMNRAWGLHTRSYRGKHS